MENTRSNRHGDGMTAPSTMTPADLLTALTHSELDATHLAQVAALIEVASALEDVVTAKGGAGLGSIVTVTDRAGETSEYELIARPTAQTARAKVPLTTPAGKTLLGARPGDHIHLTQPNGNRRRVQVTAVRPGPATSLRAALQGTAAAK
jgi:transcription elongation GreA/GreB family factor